MQGYEKCQSPSLFPFNATVLYSNHFSLNMSSFLKNHTKAIISINEPHIAAIIRA